MDRSLLSRATDGSDAPTPGYLYNDIAKNAASSPIACSEIATYLTRRLSSKQNPNIKYKCLKVIAKVSVDPSTRGQLKRAVSQNAAAVSAIKEALQFRGPQDAARGDLLNERVRTAAKEALDAIYSDTPIEHHTGAAAAGGGGMLTSSYGASPHMSSGGGGGGYSSGGMGSSSGGSRMQGIGNPMYADPRLEVQKGIANMTVGEVVSSAGETIVAMVKDPLARNIDVPPPSTSRMGGYGGGGGGGYSGPPPGRNQLASATNGQWTMASNRGPGAIAPPENYNSDRDAAYFKARDGGSNAFSWAQSSNASGGGGRTTGGVGGGVGGSWGSASGGGIASQARQPAYGGGSSTSSTTPSVTLTQNQHAPPTGTGGTAASDGSYERNLIMELCPPGGMKAEPPPDKLANFARAVPSLDPDLVCPALLDCLEEGQPWIIRAKALCVMDVVIGVEQQQGGDLHAYSDFFHACSGEIEPLASHPRAAIKEPAKRVLKALGIEPGSSGVPTNKPTGGFRPPAQQAAPAPVAEAPNLLDFDDEPAAPPPAAAPPTPVTDSLFGGLTTKEAKSPPATAPPPPPSTPVTTQPPAPANDMFGGMSVKGAPPSPAPPVPAESPAPATTTATDAAPVANGSAFGFMNASPAPAPAAVETVASPTTAKETFDPLLSLNMSPNTAKATLTPAQMQQLAYQQLMMQQQQQMQMAYAMQQQQQQMGGMMQPNILMMQQAQQHQQQQGSVRSIMTNNAGAAASSPFSFIDAPSKKKKEDKQFDFVQDAMKHEK